jgi:2-polyprenyl-3-methyl-5-hydroxy-6-metoxy-1,4-benzoquinol methylase
MAVLDVGCGMGYFSLPMAKMVGADGKVVCVDLQQKMINALRRRAKRRGLLERLDLRICSQDSLDIADLAGTLDFILACYVAHEVPDLGGFLDQLYGALRPEGTFLLAEPAGHITAEEFARTVSVAEKAGFVVADRPGVRKSRAVLLHKKPGE